MGRPFVEKKMNRPAAVTRLAPPPKSSNGLIGWALFVGVAVLLFLFMRFDPKLPAVTASLDGLKLERTDQIALGLYVAGMAMFILLFGRLINLGRRGRRVTRWHFDDTGIYTDDKYGQHHAAWEWIAAVESVKDGVYVDRGAAGGRVIPNSAFDSPAERTAFFETFARRGIRVAKAVQG